MKHNNNETYQYLPSLCLGMHKSDQVLTVRKSILIHISSLTLTTFPSPNYQITTEQVSNRCETGVIVSNKNEVLSTSTKKVDRL